MTHNRRPALTTWLAIGVLLASLAACSSSGDGGGGGGGGGTPATTVSGTVSSPGGMLAKATPTKLQRFFASLAPSEAWAQVIGGWDLRACVAGRELLEERIVELQTRQLEELRAKWRRLWVSMPTS